MTAKSQIESCLEFDKEKDSVLKFVALHFEVIFFTYLKSIMLFYLEFQL